MLLLIIINIAMQKPASPSRHDLSTPKQQPRKQFPNIQFRKLSLHTTEHPKYLIKFSKMISNQSNTQPLAISSLEKHAQEEQQNLQKNNSFLKKRIFITPNKFPSKEKVQELLENELVRRQIEELQNQGASRDQAVFNSALKDFGLIGGEDFIGNFKTNTNTKQYQGYRKRNNEKKDKLKPIISQSHINNGMHGLEFFNVGKMNLLDGDKHKKSTSLLARSYGEEPQSECIYKFMKEVNSIKDRVGKKGIIFQSEHQGKEPLKMQTLSPSQRFFQSEHTIMIPRLETQQRQRGRKGQTVLHIQRRSPNTQKQAQSPSPKHHQVRRHSKKFTIPFETYHYRDLIWKVNFSNQRIVEIPMEYEHRVKVFVGRGNNSCMVSGLITRRPWFAFTDRAEEANFVWTQLKQLTFLKRQESFKAEIGLQQRDKAKYRHESILTDLDAQHFKSYFKTHFSSEQRNDQRLASRWKYLKYRQIMKVSDIYEQKVHNHLINNYILGNKKALFNTMSNYYKENKEDVFSYLPLTFHIKDGLEDKKYFQFLKYYHKRAKEISKASQEKGHIKQYNAWIVKPGQNSNRGNGIKMCLTLQQIKAILKKRQKYPDGSYRTYIVQSYIQRPLLYYRRKFDLRHYIMMTSVNGIIKGYWYKHGYVRTTSNQYTLTQNAGSIHLTNDAVQKNLPDYGKYQKGNKISYEELSSYIDKQCPRNGRSFENYIYPRMKKIATDAMRASSGGIDPNKLQNNFQIFGMDFMIDANLQVWLIEINTNPCLQLSCPLLGCIIPKMVQNALELTLDAFFPPPVRFCPKGMHYYKQLEKENKFELVYDERVESLYDGSLEVLDNKLLEEEDDTFEDCGEDWEDK